MCCRVHSRPYLFAQCHFVAFRNFKCFLNQVKTSRKIFQTCSLNNNIIYCRMVSVLKKKKSYPGIYCCARQNLVYIH